MNLIKFLAATVLLAGCVSTPKLSEPSCPAIWETYMQEHVDGKGIPFNGEGTIEGGVNLLVSYPGKGVLHMLAVAGPNTYALALRGMKEYNLKLVKDVACQADGLAYNFIVLEKSE